MLGVHMLHKGNQLDDKSWQNARQARREDRAERSTVIRGRKRNDGRECEKGAPCVGLGLDEKGQMIQQEVLTAIEQCAASISLPARTSVPASRHKLLRR